MAGGSRRYRSIFSSPFGAGAVVAGEEGLLEIFLPFAAAAGEVQEKVRLLYPGAASESLLSCEAARALERYLTGAECLPVFPLDLAAASPFTRKVYEATCSVPRGEVRSYGWIAATAGAPGAARAAGGALARNRLPLIIPCHRIVAADGTLTGFTAPGGVGSKRLLLEMEGIRFDAAGRVVGG